MTDITKKKGPRKLTALHILLSRTTTAYSKKRKRKLPARESRTASKSAKVLQRGVGEVDGEEDEEAGGSFRLLLRLDQRGIRTREKKKRKKAIG
jgi:hypothetical protein